MRRQYVSIERSVKSLGTLCFALAAFLPFWAWFIWTGTILLSAALFGSLDLSGSPLVVLLAFAASAAVGVVGWGLRTFQPWSRRAAAVVGVCCIALSLLCLLVNPIIGFIVLSVATSRLLFLSEAGVARVLSRDYAAAVRATPYLDPKPKVWLVVLLVFAAVVLVAVARTCSIEVH